MKLKRFNEFIALNESIHEVVVEEQLFMIDGEIYEIGYFDVDLTWEHQPAEPEVGIFGSSNYVEDYELYRVTGAMRLVNPELRNEILDILTPPSDDISAELAGFGFKEEASEDRITDIAFTGDWQENWKDLKGEELKVLSDRFISLYKSKQLKQIVGNFADALQTEIDRAEEDYEDDGDDPSDYYDYDDRY